MKKFYNLLLLSFVIFSANAQRSNTQKKFVPITGIQHINGGKSIKKPVLQLPRNGIASKCSAVNLPVPAAWGKPVNYIFDAEDPIDSGFVTGTNLYDFAAIGQYFDASATSYKYISAAYVGFGNAFSTEDSVIIPIEVYDGTNGSPGRLIGSSNLYMKDIVTDVKGNNYSAVTFSPALALPTSKKFFVTVNMNNISWYYDPADTLAVFSSQQDKGTGAWLDYYTSQTTTKWATYKTVFGTDLALYIHPFISEDATCDLLPVHLLSFNVEGKNKNAVLNWKVTQEYNMSSYSVERASGTNYNFASVGTVAATNSSLDHAYSFTDVDALSANTILYYRLKQTDKDGKSIFSNILTIEPLTNKVDIKVVNPFKNAVQLQVNTPYVQKMQGGIYDMLGRKVAAAPEQVLQVGQNTVTIPAGTLPKGVYVLNVTVGKTTYKYKIIN